MQLKQGYHCSALWKMHQRRYLAILSLIRESPRRADPYFPSTEIIKNPNPNKENTEIPNIDETFHSIQ